MNNNYVPLEYLAIAAKNRYYSEVYNTNDGYWLNIFDFLKCVKNNQEDNKYPLIINENYQNFPKFYNCSNEYKFNNIIEIVEWDNRKIINIIHYRYITRQNYRRISDRMNLFLETEAYYFLNENLID
tara:strand:+ start:3545 stop:3925 length:381 start_codon:yes stop_codon:yes gene_type:complete